MDYVSHKVVFNFLLLVELLKISNLLFVFSVTIKLFFIINVDNNIYKKLKDDL